uniref:ATPase inhibitor, mitochondrial n=1 Tax=Moschus moschiferus TaxID=68415 RepID=A0A8C6DZC8_MOSMO
VVKGAGWVWDAGGAFGKGAFGKREQAEGKRSFRARARELQLTALKKHHENEISHHTKEIECLQRETERHKREIKYDTNKHIFDTETDSQIQRTDFLWLPGRGRAGQGRMGSLGLADANCCI